VSTVLVSAVSTVSLLVASMDAHWVGMMGLSLAVPSDGPMAGNLAALWAVHLDRN